MGEFNLPKTDYYELIKEISSTNPEKPAVINSDDLSVTYSGILKAYKSISDFFLHSEIKSYSRITISCSDTVGMLFPPLFV